MVYFVEALIKERKKQKLNQRDLGKKLGLSQSWISKIEVQKDNFTVDMMHKYCVALNVSPFYLMFNELSEEDFPEKYREVHNSVAPMISNLMQVVER